MVQRSYVSLVSSHQEDGARPAHWDGLAPGEDRLEGRVCALSRAVKSLRQLNYLLSAPRPRRLLRLVTAAICGSPPSSNKTLRNLARSSRSMSTNSNAIACGRAPRTIACALMFRTPCDSFSERREPGARWRSPEPIPPPRLSSGIDKRKFSRKLVVTAIRFLDNFKRA